MKEEFAKYVGLATTRRMTEQNWAEAGISDQGTVTWNAANGFAVPRSQFTDEAWASLTNDPGIVFTGERPSSDELHDAKVTAAVARMRTRAAALAPQVDAEAPAEVLGTPDTNDDEH